MTRAPNLVLTPRGLRGFGRVYPCSIGRGGIRADKTEGDEATPRGVLTIVGCLYRADRVARPAPWAEPILPRDGWSDDPADPAYNQLVARPHPFSHERLWRADRQYDVLLLTDWNWPISTPGRGSAIFIHAWRAPRRPTAGCIAVAAPLLRRLARLLPPGAAVNVDQAPVRAPNIAEPTRT